MTPPPDDAGRSLATMTGPTVLFFVVLALMFLLLGSILQLVNLPVGTAASELLLFFLPAVLFLRAFNIAPARYLGLDRGLSRRTLVLVLVAAGGNYLLASGAMGLLDQVLPKSFHIVDIEKILGAVHGPGLVLLLFAVIVLAPLCEETVFRGVLQQPLVSRLGPAAGIGITAFLFSAMHADPIGFLPRLELGVLFGWLYLRTGSLWAPMLAHAINNGTASVLFLVAGGGSAAGGATAPPGSMRTLLGLMGVGLLIVTPAVMALHRTLPRRELPQRPPPIDPEAPVTFSPDSPPALGLGLLVLLTVAAGALLLAGALAPLFSRFGTA